MSPAEHLDLLAQAFLAAGSEVYWKASAEWFDGLEIVIDGPDGESEETEDSPATVEDDGLVVVARQVRPPLRRWAAERLVRADPCMWGAMVARARELDARSGAAVVRGILDAIDILLPPAAKMLLALAADWPQRDVREAARQLRPPPAGDDTRGDSNVVADGSRRAAAKEPTLF